MNVQTKPVKHAAPGQYLGFSLQSVRLTYHLLTCPAGASVSLEVLDDVAVHYPDGSLLLEQIKSATKQNPISDWANDFWKALANWVDCAASGIINPQTTKFSIYVTPSRAGTFAEALSAADTKVDAQATIAEVKKAWKRLKKPPACEEYIEKFFGAHAAHCEAVAVGLSVNGADNNPLEPLRALVAVAVAPELVDRICHFGIGSAKEQVDALIRRGEDAILSGDEFKRNFRGFIQANNLPGYLAPLSFEPDKMEVEAVLSERPQFIRQLELIEASRDQRIRAVSDFLRTSADKVLWAESGRVFKHGLDDWDGDLVRRHSFIASEVAITHETRPATEKGMLVYGRCSVLQPPLEGRVVPSHFVHGCYNALANELRLGWHPNYKALLED